jgi:hypothetical protein
VGRKISRAFNGTEAKKTSFKIALREKWMKMSSGMEHLTVLSRGDGEQKTESDSEELLMRQIKPGDKGQNMRKKN